MASIPTVYWHGLNKAKMLSLVPNEIHIWRASLKSWADFPPNILSPAEVQRGRRFLREEHRRRFCLARAFLRLILARYATVKPANLQFQEGPHGKPYLVENSEYLQFNLSHSQDLAVYALTLQDEIGIDVEWLDNRLDVQPLATRFFTPKEAQAVLSLPVDQQAFAFYQIWTRKEAYLKALGLGLSGLSQEMQEQAGATCNFDPAPEYVGALSIIRSTPLSNHQIRHFDIN